jgi:2-hydroxy-6-oxonona-2,4-dienedioate hydrolase
VAKRKFQSTVVNKTTRPITREMLRGKLIGKWVMVGGVSMFYRVSLDPVPAEQPPIVLVHGYVVSGRYLLPTAHLLAPYYRVYVPDLPGFGNSGKPAHAHNITEQADALAAWMQQLGLQQAVVLGQSFGCQIVTELAVRHPELVQSLLLVDPTVNPHAQNLFLLAISWAATMLQEPLSLIWICLQSLLKTNIWKDIRTLQFMLEDHITDRLSKIQVPVLVVCGSRDTIAPQSWAEEATALLAQGELAVIKSGVHAVNYDSPTALEQVIRSFLSQRDLSTTANPVPDSETNKT